MMDIPNIEGFAIVWLDNVHVGHTIHVRGPMVEYHPAHRKLTSHHTTAQAQQVMQFYRIVSQYKFPVHSTYTLKKVS